jgi:hypothetical protein
MSIPLSLIGQMILNSQTSSIPYWFGAGIVVLSFIWINHETRETLESPGGVTGSALNSTANVESSADGRERE